MNKITNAFPFELALKTDVDNQELFIKTVEQILEENLQSKKTFGCQIKKCHMHIGSKIHTNEFIEAELLFHNSYYNSHFAWLTKRYIEYKTNKKDISSIILVGYETFGELYLLECVSMLKKDVTCPVYYCVAEAKGSSVKIRSTIPYDIIGPDKNPFFVFIVPISTTLTTHDKLMAAYKDHLTTVNDWVDRKDYSTAEISFNDDNSINIALIVIGTDNDNDYWKEVKVDTSTFEYGEMRFLQLLDEKQKLLTELGDRYVRYFVRHHLNWELPKKCVDCYPDLQGKRLTEETPIFEVSKESIVPVLKIGIEDVPGPLNNSIQENNNQHQNATENIKKIIDLSSFMYAKHIVRNGNHYQYYINTQEYIEHLQHESNVQSLRIWEKTIKEEIFPSGMFYDNSFIVYDFLVAPRHFSNAGFVHEVNSYIFNDSARVLYIDVTKEYRKNLLAKYSDFSAQVQKIAGSKQKSKIRFHFVDDMINTGSSFYRAKSLVNSLIGDINTHKNKECIIELFSSIIVLVDRNSKESRKNYIEKLDRFYSFVYLSISSLRNQENSCVLCNIRKSFKILRKEAALNEISNKFREYYKKYEIKDCQKLKPKYYAKDSERLLMIVGHILEERLSNRWWYKKDNGEKERAITTKDNTIGAIDIENRDQVLKVLEFYYKYLPRFINQYSKTSFSVQDIEIAMIKIISRPYFTNHIRCRQASFKFCINMLSEYQNLPKAKLNNKIKHMKALINALSDMNANYLFRRNNMELFLDIKDLQKHYIRAIKKEISLSNDDNKSVLLEHSLVNGNENWLLEYDNDDKATNQSLSTIVHQKSWMELYFENNSVLKSSLIKARLIDSFALNEYPYYLNSFLEIMKVQGINDNTVSLLNNYISAFSKLYSTIEKNNDKNKDIEKVADCMISMLCCDSQFKYAPTYIFIKNKNQVAEGVDSWNRYQILAKNDNASDIDFYSSSHLKALDLLTGGDNDQIVSVMKTIYYYKKSTSVTGQDADEFEDTTVINLYEEADACLYLQIEKSIGDVTATRENIKANTLHFLLPLKMLLCIRYEIAKYLKKCNVLSYLQGKKFKDVTTALSIRKASKHQALEINEGNFGHYIMFAIYSEAVHSDKSNLNNIVEQAKNNFYKNDFEFPSSFVEAYGQVAQKYMQYLANEYISSLYREMVKFSTHYYEESTSNNGNRLTLSKTSLNEVLTYFERMGFEKSEDGSTLSAILYVPNHNTKKSKIMIGDQKVRIVIYKNSFSNERVIWTRKSGQLTAYYYLLILSLSMNAGKHFYQRNTSEEICNVNVEIDKEYLVVRNNISEEVLKNNELEDIRNNTKKRMLTPPWFFPRKEQSITLWTLFTFMEIFQKNKKIRDSISVNETGIEIQGNNWDTDWIRIIVDKDELDGKPYFEIRLKLIGSNN